eukprot:TRINITY_DN25438_c0_g1_i1.p1 TRINITY_DN25438_c0_g1~~TRINITY_DN25438_c0_g1_i1.p1  ORF type:complete len:273 (+),score=84.82 TRINITY_DN25438_c0_g1_i1:49-867(+)
MSQDGDDDEDFYYEDGYADDSLDGSGAGSVEEEPLFSRTTTGPLRRLEQTPAATSARGGAKKADADGGPLRPGGGRDRDEVKKERSKRRHDAFWRKWACPLSGIFCLLLLVACVLWAVYAGYYQPCSIFLQEVRISKLPERRFYISETIGFNLILSVENPNKAAASIEHAYLRISIIDQENDLRYDVHDPIRFPASSIPVPPETTTELAIAADVKVALLSEGLRVVMLIHQGCFTLNVVGEVTYNVASFPHTTHVNRTQQLFAKGACAVCSP